MSPVQQLVMAVLPRGWREAIRRESERWLLRCPECGHSCSVWAMGGIRFKAMSVGRKVWAYCPQCGQKRNVSLEYNQE